MEPWVIGLDIETSGTSLAGGHRLIQIGVALDATPDGVATSTELYCELVGWNRYEMVWDAGAAAVHGIGREAIYAAARAAEIDAELSAWLEAHGASAARAATTIPCGFNVASFDLPFVAAALPRTAALVSHRCAELNSLCFLLGSSVALPDGSPPSFAAWKAELKRVGLAAVARTGRTAGEHDAGTDALMSLAAWRHAQAVLATTSGR